MQVKKLVCCEFRNLKNIEIEPDPEMNVISGENAQGKTNIIEAIWLFTGAKSFRGTKEVSYINFDAKRAKTELLFNSKGVLVSASQEFSEKRTVFFNEKPLSSPQKLAGEFTAVVFSPSDLGLVKEGPNIRRRFLDLGIGQLYPNYIEILKEYNRAVIQRNKIIKDFKYDTSLSVMLDVFEEEIAAKGEKIIRYRMEYLNMLDNFVPKIYEEISKGKEKFKSLYVANSCDMLKERLKKARKEDTFSGVTSVGPHRDDVDFKINNISVRNYGSQGQQRSVALALKLAQAEVTREKMGEYPVILLDDVMSELDVERQSFVLNHIKGKQSFISCCDPSNVARLKEGKIFRVKGGSVI